MKPENSGQQRALLYAEGIEKMTTNPNLPQLFRDIFRGAYSLEHYTEVKEWDHGYIVAMAKYKQNDRPEEEYIDLIPILKNLYFDPETFLAPIKEVRVANG